MHTENHITIQGPIDRVFELAAEVTRWPEILPHYRWVKLISQDGRRRVVEMAAHRDGIPVKWVSIQEPIPTEKRILFRHIGGPTRGMDVEWTMRDNDGLVHVTINHEFKPVWPVIGPLAEYIIGRFFVHNIAGKTLARIKQIVEEEGKRQPSPPTPLAIERGERKGILMKKRVVITGIGAVTSIGTSVDGLWDGILANRSGVSEITSFDTTGYRTKVAGEVRGFDPTEYVSAKNKKRLDRFAGFAVAAARMAAEDSGLNLATHRGAGVVMGSALGGLGFAEEQHDVFRDRGLSRVHPALALLVFGASSSCHVAIELGLKGPNLTNSNSCSSGTIAVGEGFEMIRSGRASVVLAGGAEAPLFPLTFGSFVIIKAMTARNDDPAGSCRPFDRDRDGFVMGEGSAMLVLEDMEHALVRGARIYAEVMGYGLTNDAFHMTSSLPGGECAAEAINVALNGAGLAPTDIGYVNVHGSSTPMNDKHETEAIKRALGEHAYKIPVSSTKPFHAHPLGATGAIEAAICALALKNQYLPPTLNLENPDPDCDLDYIPKEGRKAKVDYVLSNSFGFGGMNAALVLGRV